MKKLIGVAICLAVAGIAFATVTFNPATGIGFCGKGDVQSAFGWNNAQLQANASGVTFSYSFSNYTEGVCEWWTGPDNNRKVHYKTETSGSEVNGSVAYDARKVNQINGFNLEGFGEDFTVIEGDYDNPNFPMVLDGPCPGNPGNEGVWVEINTTSLGGGLYANYGDNSVLIWP